MSSRPQERRARVKGTAAGRGFGTHPPTQFFLFPQNVNRVFPIQVWGIEAKGKGEDLGLQLLGRLRNWGISFSKVWDLVVRIVKIRIIAKSAQGGHQRSAPLGSRNCGRIQVLLDELADRSRPPQEGEGDRAARQLKWKALLGTKAAPAKRRRNRFWRPGPMLGDKYPAPPD